MRCDCDNLDAYLDDDLSADDAARYLVHLNECETCREAAHQQGWIDGLLRSLEQTQLETPPAELVHSIRTSLRPTRRKPQLIACGLAAAAALILAVGWILELNRHADRDVRIEVATKAPTAPVEVVAKYRESTVVGGPDMIVVPVASRHPDVTIVRVFPTYQPDISTHVSTEQPLVTDDFAWPDGFNGG